MANDTTPPPAQGATAFPGWQADHKREAPTPAKPAARPGAQGPQVVVRPMAEPAAMRTRHRRLLASFIVFVILPLLAVIAYMIVFANDQYSSTTGFTVRQEEAGAASEILGGLTQIVGGSGGSDADILFEFVQSQEMVEAISAKIDLQAHYGQHWPSDWAFSLPPESSIEDLLWFWGRIVRISLDSSSGLIEVRVLAFDPDMAQQIGRAILEESQAMINELNAQARSDAMGYAEADLEIAKERLKQARGALTQFRTRTQIVDPEADIQGRMGVVNNLQQQLAEALIVLEKLRDTTNASDPRVVQAMRETEVIRSLIASERSSFTNPGVADSDAEGEDYPALLAEFESLSVDREFAEETYRAALTALDLARNNAQRQSRYLATFIEPTRAQTSEFPQRIGIVALAALFLGLGWSIVALIYYSIRDRN